MRALLALSAAVGLTYFGLAQTSERQPVVQQRTAPVAETIADVPAPESPYRPQLLSTPQRTVQQLLPIRAAKQPAGLPGQVTLTVQNGLPGGLTLTAAPIGSAGFDGWAGYDAPRNCTHIVYRLTSPTHHSTLWLYDVVRGNGIPPSPPAGSEMSFRLGQPGELRNFPTRPVSQWVDPYWVPPPVVPLPVLPLVGGYMVGRADLPYSGAVTVR